jgi:hypothetical protein
MALHGLTMGGGKHAEQQNYPKKANGRLRPAAVRDCKTGHLLNERDACPYATRPDFVPEARLRKSRKTEIGRKNRVSAYVVN